LLFLPCIYLGCIDTSACNYDNTANEDNGSCFYPGNVTVSQDPIICIGDTTQLVATGGVQYFWDGVELGNTITVAPTSTTSYEVKIVEDNSCETTLEVTVEVHDYPIAVVNDDFESCPNEMVSLTASGGDSYDWDGLGTEAVLEVALESTTTYYVTVTNGLNCSDTDSVTITTLPAPTANAGTDQNICMSHLHTSRLRNNCQLRGRYIHRVICINHHQHLLLNQSYKLLYLYNLSKYMNRLRKEQWKNNFQQ